MTVNYDAGADLNKQIVEQHKPGQYVVTATEKIWSGTLEGCIKQYLAKPLSNRPVYNILIGEEAESEKQFSNLPTSTLLRRARIFRGARNLTEALVTPRLEQIQNLFSFLIDFI